MKKYYTTKISKLVLFIVAEVCGSKPFHPMKGRGFNKVFSWRATGSHR